MRWTMVSLLTWTVKHLTTQWAQRQMYRKRPSTKFIIFHDSHTPPEVTGGRAYLVWRGRQMGLLDVGYHYVIDRDGRSVTTRAIDVMGSHCPGYNHESVGICLVGGRTMGDTPVDDFTDAQQMEAMKLCRWVFERYHNRDIKIVGHTELQHFLNRPKSHRCPSMDMNDFRKRLAKFVGFDIKGP